MNKDITNYNNKGQYHGYQEWYIYADNPQLWVRCNYTNNESHGYQEWHIVKQTKYYIR